MTLSRWYHSIKFIPVGGMYEDGRDTWDDWHLIPVTRPVVNPPSLKTTIVELPGVDGEIDLSDYIDPLPVYTNRKGSWTFAVKNGFKSWDVLYSDIMRFFGRTTFYIILQDDMSYMYKGKLSVNKWESNASFSTIVIDYNVEPYRIDRLSSREPWEWDIFDFEAGYIYPQIDSSYTIGQTGHLEFVNETGDLSYFDYVWISQPNYRVKITNDFITTTINLASGRNDISYILFPKGKTIFDFTGSSNNTTVMIAFRGRRL